MKEVPANAPQMKAVKRFKRAIQHKRPPGVNDILGKDTRMVQPPLSMSTPSKPPLYHKTKSDDASDRRPIEQALAKEGVHRDIDTENIKKQLPERQDTGIAYSPMKRSSTQQSDEQGSPTSNNAKRNLHANPQDHKSHHAATEPVPIDFDHHGKGQARDPLSEHRYLGLGPGGSSRPPSPATVSESPPATEPNIYESAYDQEIRRLRSLPRRSTSLFLTRRVSHKEEYRQDDDLIRGKSHDEAKPKSGLARVLEQAKLKTANDDPSKESNDDQAMDEGTKDGTHETKGSKAGHEPMGVASAAGMVRNILGKQE